MDFKDQVKQDVKQYNALLNRYELLNSEDFATAFDIARTALILADRWNEVQVQAAKHDIGDLSKTDFQKWAYGKYRQLHLVHEHARSIWRMGEQFSKERRITNE